VETELCDACHQELAHRLGEVEIAPGLPIITAIAKATATAKQRTAMSEPCIYGAKFEKDQYGQPTKNLMRSCNKLSEPGGKLCPRHKLIQQLADDAKAAKKSTGVRCAVAAKVAR
jgi:hypothetical protein